MTITSNNSSTDSLHDCETERKELLRLHDTEMLSWPKIAQMTKYRGIPVGSLWSFANGKRDLSDKHKAQLGIPFEVSVTFCIECNEVHTFNCHTQKVKPKQKPKPPKWVSLSADFLAEHEQVGTKVYNRKGKCV